MTTIAIAVAAVGLPAGLLAQTDSERVEARLDVVESRLAVLEATLAATVRMEWTDGSDNEDGFRAWLALEGRDLEPVATAPAGAQSIELDGLALGTAYRFGVSAYNGAGESEIAEASMITSGDATVVGFPPIGGPPPADDDPDVGDQIFLRPGDDPVTIDLGESLVEVWGSATYLCTPAEDVGSYWPLWIMAADTAGRADVVAAVQKQDHQFDRWVVSQGLVGDSSRAVGPIGGSPGGEPLEMRWHYRAASAPGVADGVFELWVADELIEAAAGPRFEAARFLRFHAPPADVESDEWTDLTYQADQTDLIGEIE